MAKAARRSRTRGRPVRRSRGRPASKSRSRSTSRSRGRSNKKKRRSKKVGGMNNSNVSSVGAVDGDGGITKRNDDLKEALKVDAEVKLLALVRAIVERNENPIEDQKKNIDTIKEHLSRIASDGMTYTIEERTPILEYITTLGIESSEQAQSFIRTSPMM